jgi:serine/threonine protein phosphatase PrpC
MSAQPQEVTIQVAAVSDRGLSEKRPLNEDSYLSDQKRRIFAVADGVGGAQAGEVASKTAVEVLDEAFHHQVAGTDIEDLMEIAIQRANSSIFQMAQDHPKLSAMATTIVALHLDGHIATIGHVGDSRLYRLSPDGQLHRETADHSVVEEEVRAGRMTPEQAAHHPSRNVISRALGAEASVEVDMKTIEVADGTSFLLCSDGITRHIPDDEIRSLLGSNQSAEEICAEMKRRCYERGAEDNLTALIVRVGNHSAANTDFDDERTVLAVRPDLAKTMDGTLEQTPAVATQPPNQTAASAPAPVAPPSASLPPPPISPKETLHANPVVAFQSQAKSRSGKGGLRALLLLLLLLAVAGGAFYGGIYYQRQQANGSADAKPSPSPPPDRVQSFENERRRVDENPRALKEELENSAKSKGLPNPSDSKDAEFLYLYGRSLFLLGDYSNALSVFDHGSESSVENSPELDAKLKVDSRLAMGATALMISKQKPNTLQEKESWDAMVKKAVDKLREYANKNNVTRLNSE